MVKSLTSTRAPREFSSWLSGNVRDDIAFVSGNLCMYARNSYHQSCMARSDWHHNRLVETHFTALATMVFDIFAICVSGLSLWSGSAMLVTPPSKISPWKSEWRHINTSAACCIDRYWLLRHAIDGYTIEWFWKEIFTFLFRIFKVSPLCVCAFYYFSAHFRIYLHQHFVSHLCAHRRFYKKLIMLGSLWILSFPVAVLICVYVSHMSIPVWN